MFQRSMQRVWLAYVVLLAGLTLSIIAWLYVQNSVAAAEAMRFDNAVRMARQSLDQQMQRYVDVLLATRGFVQASEPVTRAEWKTYTQSIDLAHHYPGMQGIGYAARVPLENVPQFQAQVRAEGFRNFIIRPPGIRPVYFPVLYLEPFDMRNQRALGFDLGSETVRHEAMERAAWTGMPAASGRLTLLQEDGIDPQPGFIIVVPDYTLDMPTDTQEERAAALRGFIYSPYRAHVLFHGLFEHQRYLAGVHWQVYAAASAQPASLLYDSEDGRQVEESSELAAREIVADIAGQTWYLRLAALPSFRTSTENFLPWLVLLSGVLMSWLFCGVTWQQIRGRTISEQATAGLRRSQQALQESELRYRSKVEQSPMAIAVFNSAGDALYQNAAFHELFNVTAADLAGYNILDHPQLSRAGVMSDVKRAFAGESVRIGPYLYQPSAGGHPAQARWVRSVLYPIRDAEGALREVVVMHEDFTQRKAAEEELQRAKEEAEAANRSKDQFLAVLSHELRNPLAPVLTSVNMLQEHQLSAEEFADALNMIQRNVELEARLIDDLLDITRIIRGKLNLDLDTVDAHTALRHALEICQTDLQHKQQQKNILLEASAHFVTADSARLQQVFWNVIKNAVKFTPAGGSIRVRTFNRPGAASREGSGAPVSQAEARPELVVEITDTGIGIEPKKLDLIFEAFEQVDHSITRRFGGLGLGLAISRALVEAHHGTLRASSQGSGQGTTFTLTLPTVPAPAPRLMPPGGPAGRGRADQAIAQRADHEKPRILLVEDQDDARRGLAKILEKSGYTVFAAANAEEAKTLARTERFDVLLSDLGLPDASGFDLVRALRRDARHWFYAVALSGLGMEDDVQRAREAGFDEHLTKPVQFARLMGLIAKCTAAR